MSAAAPVHRQRSHDRLSGLLRYRAGERSDLSLDIDPGLPIA